MCEILTSFSGSERSPCGVRCIFDHGGVTVIETLLISINVSYPSGEGVQRVSGNSSHVMAERSYASVAKRFGYQKLV